MKMVRFIFSISILAVLYGCRKDPAWPVPSGDNPDDTLVYDPTPYPWVNPPGFPDPVFPPDNPLTVEGVELGRKLFYDPILSGDSTQSCASCHMQFASFTDTARYSKGIDGIEGHRNSMPLINVAWMPRLFWDGRAVSPEDQALHPVRDPIEMHNTWPEAVKRLQRHPKYPAYFYEAFGTKNIDSILVVKAIGQFVRTLVSANSKFDRYLRGEVMLTPGELSGLNIFTTETGDCFHCHGGPASPLFTDNDFHNNGLDETFSDQGYGAVTGNSYDMGKFKTPTLRNVELTAPYMHDGRFKTLQEVIEHYNSGIKHNSPNLDPIMNLPSFQNGLNLNPQQKADLIAFLKTLTDTSFIHNPKFSNPFTQ